jgi:hypothetical protein
MTRRTGRRGKRKAEGGYDLLDCGRGYPKHGLLIIIPPDRPHHDSTDGDKTGREKRHDPCRLIVPPAPLPPSPPSS